MENEVKESNQIEETEKFFDHSPKVLHDGSCQHDFEVYSEDDAFIYERCRNCPVGRRRNKE